MKCAPIIIPTLNRIEHLKRCIDSLKENPLALETDLYISVDYPPEEKYFEGYQLVKKYVTEELKGGFRNIFYYIQSENLGPEMNFLFLKEKSIMSSNKAYIFTEDDNVFSPAFLDYINKSLIKYEKNEKIYRICGYSPLDTINDVQGDAFLLDYGCAWGIGVWREKEDIFEKWLTRDNFILLLKDNDICESLYQRSYKKYWNLVETCLASPNENNNVFNSQIDNNIRNIDYTVGLYLTIKGFYALFPRISLVKNEGFDGTGVNCGAGDFVDKDYVLYDRNSYNISEFLCLQESEEKEIFKDSENYLRAKKARIFRRIFMIFGIGIARKAKEICLYLEYKFYIVNKFVLSKEK